jgi:glycosyltransferase involved in cell wall biosynthesis
VSPQVIYTAAHGGFQGQNVPLGGGAAVCEHLCEEWRRTKPFPLVLIEPSILGVGAPSARDVVRFGERDYARFSRAFEAAATKEILRRDPRKTVVLANDVSEGPDFQTLAGRGFSIFTIYHVDVVAYVTDIYLRGKVKPQTTVRWYRKFGAMLPAMAKLVWEKQEASVLHSKGLIVPSAQMKEVLLRCYPECDPAKIHVLPWGSWQDSEPGDAAALRREYSVPSDAHVLLTLSRISPEKGQDVLLDVLYEWERRADYPERPLWLFLCGDAAFMQGRRYMETLQAKAARLRRTKVVFPGYVTGDRKRAFFALADLYVFPSRHESYGLTLLEALTAGLPAVCLDHAGARGVMRPEFGRLVREGELREAVAGLLKDDATRKGMGAAAREFAKGQRFSVTAARLAEILMGH